MNTNKNDELESVMTEEQLQNEFDYMMAQQMLGHMLVEGIISLVEYNKISAKNLGKFSPQLASILP